MFRSDNIQRDNKRGQQPYQAVLTELGEFAQSSINMDAILQEAVNAITSTLQVDYCEVLELRSEEMCLFFRAGTAGREEFTSAASKPRSNESLEAWTFLHQEPLVVQDYESEYRFGRSVFVQRFDFRSSVSIGIRKWNSEFGLLQVYSIQRMEFTPAQIHFLQAAANILAATLERIES